MCNKEDLKKLIPGFSMGIVRSIISHPFEMMKLKSQINYSGPFYKNLFKGLHYSIITNSCERSIQFGLYEKFKLNDNNITSSLKASFISTLLSFPYNIILLKKSIMNDNIFGLTKNILYKTSALEYSRNLSGSTIFLSSYNYLKHQDTPIIIRAPMSSIIVWVITYPIDSYKNILLTQQFSSCFNKISIGRLYKGIQYPLMRSIPSSIIGFYIYEFMLNIINN